MVPGIRGMSYDVVQLADFAMIKGGLRNFYCNHAVQPRVARFVHFAHAAFPDGREDFVGTKECTGSHGHG